MTIAEEIRTDRESGARRLESEYKAGLMTLARQFCADEGDAEELVNRTFSAVVDGIDEYVEQSAFFGWMCRILSNIRAKDLRRKSHSVEIPDSDAVSSAADPDAELRLYRDVDAGLLRDEIEALPPEMKETIVLHYILGQPLGKVAKILSLPVGTVKSRLHYGRIALASKLGAAAKKPGAKALVVALALCGFAALGAAVAAWAGKGTEGTDGTKATPAMESPHGGLETASPSAKNAGFVPGAPSPGEDSSKKETTTMKSSTFLSLALGAALATGAPFAIAQEPDAAPASSVLYANDFSARTGASAVPSQRWKRHDYVPGTVVYNYANAAGGSYAWTDGLPWADPSKIQDGWVLSGNGTWAPSASAMTNNAAERPGDTESPFLAFSINNANFYSSRAYQPIGNSFTNGVVEYWVDMRAPGKWGSTSSMPYFLFLPVYRTYLGIPDNVANPLADYPAMFGPCNLTGSAITAATTRCFGGSRYNGDLGVVSDADGGYVALENGIWYRYRMTVNFETKWCSYEVWKLGADVPTWDTATTGKVMPLKSKYIYRPPTDATGPLDGIGFIARGINSGNPAVVTNMPAATNIRVGWKAHDSDAAFIPCYSNDFRTCWTRSLATGSASASYAAPSGAGENSFSSYTVNAAATCPGSQVIIGNTGSALQPVGVDGWRRISDTGAAHPSVANSNGDGANVLRVTKASGTGSSAYWAVFGNTLGETITSGKVMFSVDVRTADKWYSDVARTISVALSDSFCYASGVNSTYGPHRATLVGLRGAGETDTPYAWYVNDSTTVNDTAARGAARTWHRIVTVADLDSRTYDIAVSNLGEGASGKPADYEHAGASVILAKSGIAIRSGVTDISSFALLAYSVGDTWDGAALFDNIKVWKIPSGGATTNLVYYNDFNVRKRFNAAATTELADAPNVVAPERDFWTRRGGGVSGTTLLASSGDSCLAIEAQGANPACVVQDIGDAAAKARALSARIDMRPPSIWHANAPARASLLAMLGGDALHAASTFGGTAIPSHACIRFGFGTGGDASLSLQRLTAVKAVAADGASDRTLDFAVNRAHWYRFVAKTVLDSGSYSLSVYDQGTAHPASSDANGTLVASVSGLAFAGTGGDGGLSTLGFFGAGIADATPTEADSPSLGLFDNVVVEKTPTAFVMVVR